MKNLCIHILAAVILAAAGISASAQVGFHVGGTVPYQSMFRLDPLEISYRYGIGAYAGVDYNIHIVKGFYIAPGLYYNFTMASYSGFEEGYAAEERQTDHIIAVPVHFKYEFNIRPDRFAIYVYGGPVFSAGVSSRSFASAGIYIEVYYDNYSGRVEDINCPGVILDEERKAELMSEMQSEFDSQDMRQRRFDLQLDCGVGFRFKGHWELKTGYSFGLIDRLRGEYGKTANMMFSQYYIGFGYRF